MEFFESWNMRPELIVLIVSMLPLIEIRGGAIVGLALGLSLQETLLIGLIGNIIPIPFAIVCGRYIFELFGRSKIFGKYVKIYHERLIRKSDVIKKYGPWGLLIFVGIPLPGTGAWSGALLAVLMDLSLKKAVPAIFIGIIIAGFIIALPTLGVLQVL